MYTNNKIYQNDVQTLYLPEYTALLRKIQNETDAILSAHGFAECLFPKLIEKSSYEILKHANKRFEMEWRDEAVMTEELTIDGKKQKFMLSHWQCEPFYFFLKKNHGREFTFFDHSGWSYRLEKQYNEYRLFEFLRTEIVFCLKKANAMQRYDELIQNLFTYLQNECSLQVRLVQKNDEKNATSELRVVDIEAFEQGQWIEIVGCHLHGDIFLNALDIRQNRDYYTGCMGIGLSRIANILYNRSCK